MKNKEGCEDSGEKGRWISQKLLFRTPLHCAWLLARRRLNQLYSLSFKPDFSRPPYRIPLCRRQTRTVAVSPILFSLALRAALCDDQLSSASEREQSTSCGQPFYQKTFSDLFSC